MSGHTSSRGQDSAFDLSDPLKIFPIDTSCPKGGLPSKVTQPNDYNYYGPFDVNSLSNSASEFVTIRSDADCNTVKASIKRFLSFSADECLAARKGSDNPLLAEACWLSIRMWHPTSEYIQPRWHRDGQMFTCKCLHPQRPHSKYAFCLLGPPTRVLCPSKDLDNAFESVHQPWKYQARCILADRLQTFRPVTLHPSQIIRFSWGQPDSPIHSEPDCLKTDRIFVSVMFGQEAEIQEMCQIRSANYGELSIE
jgi:hypothetical protein